MRSVIDLHLHLLPDVDDGPPDLDGAVQMLQLARQFGYERLIATPHLVDGLDITYHEHVQTQLATVLPEAQRIGIEVGLGYEHRLTPNSAARLDDGEPSTLAGSRTVLVELPFHGWPIFTEFALSELQAAGYRPLLAHPERYAAAQNDPHKIAALAESGVLMQLTISSLTGLFGKPAKELSEWMLRRDLVTVLASDAHSSGRRFQSVEEGLRRAREVVGDERVRQLTTENPAALLSDQELPVSKAVIADVDIEANGHRKSWTKRLLTRG